MIFKNQNVKEKIFLMYTYFIIAATLSAIVVNSIIGLSFKFNIKWIISTIIYITLCILAKKQIHTKIIHRIGVYTMCFFILPLCWITGSGILAPSLLYTAVVLIMINTVLSGKERVILNIAELLVTLTLIWLFYNRPQIFHFIPPRMQFIDWMAHTPTLFAFICFLLITFEKAYEEEREVNSRREKDLEKLATTDHLTGLLNRNDMEQKISLIHSIWERGIGEYSIILLDIDYFKAFNDHHGHLEGDLCLKEIGKILKLQLRRGTDWAFRYGGEEFLLLLGVTELEGAELIGEKIKKAIYKSNIPHEDSKVSYRVTVSMGIATIADSDKTPSDLIKRADDALYRAKETGRNRICTS